MTRTIFVSSVFALLLVSAGAIGYTVGAADTDSASAACDTTQLSKPTSFKGIASGPNVDGMAEVTLNVDAVKGKVNGFIKGTRDKGKWNVGLSGTYNKKTKTFTINGANKSNNLVLKGSVCGSQLLGTASGKILDKDAWLYISANK